MVSNRNEQFDKPSNALVEASKPLSLVRSHGRRPRLAL